MKKANSKRYTDEFKQKVLQDFATGMSKGEVIKKHGISYASLDAWQYGFYPNKETAKGREARVKADNEPTASDYEGVIERLTEERDMFKQLCLKLLMNSIEKMK